MAVVLLDTSYHIMPSPGSLISRGSDPPEEKDGKDTSSPDRTAVKKAKGKRSPPPQPNTNKGTGEKAHKSDGQANEESPQSANSSMDTGRPPAGNSSLQPQQPTKADAATTVLPMAKGDDGVGGNKGVGGQGDGGGQPSFHYPPPPATMQQYAHQQGMIQAFELQYHQQLQAAQIRQQQPGGMQFFANAAPNQALARGPGGAEGIQHFPSNINMSGGGFGFGATSALGPGDGASHHHPQYGAGGGMMGNDPIYGAGGANTLGVGSQMMGSGFGQGNIPRALPPYAQGQVDATDFAPGGGVGGTEGGGERGGAQVGVNAGPVPSTPGRVNWVGQYPGEGGGPPNTAQSEGKSYPPQQRPGQQQAPPFTTQRPPKRRLGTVAEAEDPDMMQYQPRAALDQSPMAQDSDSKAKESEGSGEPARKRPVVGGPAAAGDRTMMVPPGELSQLLLCTYDEYPFLR